MTAISRHYDHTHIKADNIETHIAVYEDQIRGWFHDQARILEKSSSDAGFVILLVVLAYIEQYAIFSKGQDSKGRSKEFFKDGFKAIFPLTSKEANNPDDLDQVIESLYYQMRNGLFHTGMTRSKVILSGANEFTINVEYTPSSQSVERISVNPHAMLNTIENHLADYVMLLRNPEETQLRTNFEKAWEMRLKD